MRLNKIAILLPVVLLLFGCGGGGGTPPPPLVSIAVTPATASIANGTSQQFTATGTFSDNSTRDISSAVTWTSSNTGVATISSTGLATAISTGQTTITAASGSIPSNSATLTVTAATTVSIVVTPANPIIVIGSTQQFTATGTFSDSTTQNLTTSATWSSSNPSVATVSTTGLATPLNAGVTTISALFGGIPGSTTLTVPVPAGGTGAANVLSITVNGSLCTNYSGLFYPNKPCVSVTVCDPANPANCQTINDILLDTGSYGLRIFKQALTVLPSAGTNSLAECVTFGDGSTDWGPVQSAAVVLGGEPAVTVPIQVIDATFGNPTVCGTPEASPAAAGFKGILGVGLFAADCGAGCASAAGNGMYFTCSGTNCSGAAVPLASQVQNPVTHLPLDNNGVLVQLPAVPSGGGTSDNGQLVLGINTQSNNVSSGVTVYRANQAAEFTTIFNGATNTHSIIDSGSNALFFSAPVSLLPPCASPNSEWYCPPSTTPLSAINEGATGTPSGTVTFQVGNATALFGSGNSVFGELAGTMPSNLTGFDWGLPFFFGRSVYVGIEPYTGLTLTPTNLGIVPFWAY